MTRRDLWRDWKRRVQIPQLLEAIGWLGAFRVRGSRLTGPCPIHRGDNRQAFSIHRERNLWYCFTQCHRGGDVIDLAWLLCDRSWTRTAQWLDHLANGPLVPAMPPVSAPGRGPQRSPQSFQPFTRPLHLDPHHPFFERLGLTEATLSRFQAGAWHGRGFLAGMVAVRLHDPRGQPLGYAGRRLDPAAVLELGKWKWPPGFPKTQNLWNWHRVAPQASEGLIVVEGPWSVMKLWQAGLANVVALGGVSVSDDQARLLATAPSATLMLDGDDTGERASARLVADRIHPHISAVRPPQGLDPADLSETQLARLLMRD